MMGQIYCELVEYGMGFIHTQNSDGVIISKRDINGPSFELSNEKGKITIKKPSGDLQIVKNDRFRIENIIKIIEETPNKIASECP